MQFNELQNWDIFYSSRHHIFEYENFRFTFFYEKEPNLGM